MNAKQWEQLHKYKKNYGSKCWQQLGNCVHSYSIWWLKSRLHSSLCLQEFPEKCVSLSLANGIKESVCSPGKESLNAQSQGGGHHLGGCSTGLVHQAETPRYSCWTLVAVWVSVSHWRVAQHAEEEVWFHGIPVRDPSAPQPRLRQHSSGKSPGCYSRSVWKDRR